MTQIKDLPAGIAASTASFPADDTDTITRRYTAAQIVGAVGGLTSAPVQSVAGHTGAVTLGIGDITGLPAVVSGLGTAAALTAGGPGGAAVLDGNALVPVANIPVASVVTTASILAVLAALPTTLPSASGQLWLNGGAIAIS